VDARVLAATNELLQKKVKEKTFREDLFYRISVIPVQLPPLRERGDDLPVLVIHFVQVISQRLGMAAPRIPDEVMNVLRAYRWPGNVRELQNAIERACALCDNGVIELKDLPERILETVATAGQEAGVEEERNGANGPVASTVALQAASAAQWSKSGAPLQLKEFLHQQEVFYIEQAIKAAGGSKDKAAELLGISMATLYRKLAPSAAAQYDVESVSG
jgi:DNA-binding NtrC family response regulator